MSSEQNKAIVRRAFEEPWKGDLAVVDELVASDYIGHDPANPEPLRGPEGVKELTSSGGGHTASGTLILREAAYEEPIQGETRRWRH
jgi:hypothetical protein